MSERNNLLIKSLNKMDAFFKGKRVMITKPYKDLTDSQKSKLKRKQWIDKQGNIKSFIRVQATSIEDL